MSTFYKNGFIYPFNMKTPYVHTWPMSSPRRRRSSHILDSRLRGNDNLCKSNMVPSRVIGIVLFLLLGNVGVMATPSVTVKNNTSETIAVAEGSSRYNSYADCQSDFSMALNQVNPQGGPSIQSKGSSTMTQTEKLFTQNFVICDSKTVEANHLGGNFSFTAGAGTVGCHLDIQDNNYSGTQTGIKCTESGNFTADLVFTGGYLTSITINGGSS